MVLRTKKLLSLFLLILLISVFSSCHVVRYVFWNFADINDYRRFPADSLPASPHAIPFKKSDAVIDLRLPPFYTQSKARLNLEQFLESNGTVAFMIVRNDSVLFEKFFGTYNRTSLLPGFSVTKSVVSALIGIGIHEGSIQSVQQSVTDFIPEMKEAGFDQVTIDDLLSMRSGIRFKEGYTNPFSGMAKFYYGENLKRYTVKLKLEEEPGAQYKYQSANTQILVMILEKATGKRISEYFTEKIWIPAGMEFAGSWNKDSYKYNENKGFCCLNARPEDFVRFGQLYLNKGTDQEGDIIPPHWVDESLKIRNDSKDSQGYPYTWHWRSLENGDFFAKGILGQFIYVCPSKRIVILRMGKKAGKVIWPMFFQEILNQL